MRWQSRAYYIYGFYAPWSGLDLRTVQVFLRQVFRQKLATPGKALLAGHSVQNQCNLCPVHLKQYFELHKTKVVRSMEEVHSFAGAFECNKDMI